MVYNNDEGTLKAPVMLLQDKRLTDADKHVWLVMWLDRQDKSIDNLASPTRLAERTGRSRFIIYHCLARLAATGWYQAPQPTLAPFSRWEEWVSLPADLLTCRQLQSRDIVVYSILQSKAFRCPQARFSYQALSRNVGRCLKTVRRAVQVLKEIHWIKTKQTNRLSPIRFALDHPYAVYCRKQIAILEQRLAYTPLRGQEIAVAMTTFLLEPAAFQVESRLSCLTNPATGRLLEVDLYIEKYNLAVEYQGPQHYRPTDYSTAEEVARQQQRDAIKAQLLQDNKINLVELTAEDLSLQTIRGKLQGLAPLRDLRGLAPLARYLEEKGRRYRISTKQHQMRQASA